MSHGRHTGKIVFTVPETKKENGTVLITGGTGKLGGLAGKTSRSGQWRKGSDLDESQGPRCARRHGVGGGAGRPGRPCANR